MRVRVNFSTKMSVQFNPEFFRKQAKSNEYIHNISLARRRCCLWVRGIQSDRSQLGGSIWWERIETSEETKDDRWWFLRWRKFRKWSEIVAGPKWKTFVRRLNRMRSKDSKFNYDPLSYALNFDDGPEKNGHFDVEDLRRDFSSRFASIPSTSSCKSPMDFGKDMMIFK